jgi:predicted 3-demethylubiquinone-9 3-methyltransferase (glyoxalase superfamily)
MAPIVPCLWFDGNADDAVDQYLSLFSDSKRITTSKVGQEADGSGGTTLMVSFELNGSPFLALNGGPQYQFTPAVSFTVYCDTQDEVDHYWDGLLDGGEPSQCGWLTDRHGVSWQIVPNRLGELMSSGDGESAGRVMEAMLKMVKLDIATLEAAAVG